ncbi:MAG: hypothetical protein ABI446_02575 [Gemmatimonadaceae bacterium]
MFAPLDMRCSLLNDDATTVIPHRATDYGERGKPKIRAELAKVGIRIGGGPGFWRLVRSGEGDGDHATGGEVALSLFAATAVAGLRV